jgi:hypothetical protein
LTAPMITTLMSAAKSPYSMASRAGFISKETRDEDHHHFSPPKGALVESSTIEGGVNRPE